MAIALLHTPSDGTETVARCMVCCGGRKLRHWGGVCAWRGAGQVAGSRGEASLRGDLKGQWKVRRRDQ